MSDVTVSFHDEEVRIIKKYVTINGVKYDLEEIYEDICAIGDAIYFPQEGPHTKLFLELGILLHPGSSRWLTSAVAGENYDHYLKLFREAYYGK